jgi:hypothetical protein
VKGIIIIPFFFPLSAIGEIFQGQIREFVVGKFVRIFVELAFLPQSAIAPAFFPALFSP